MDRKTLDTTEAINLLADDDILIEDRVTIALSIVDGLRVALGEWIDKVDDTVADMDPTIKMRGFTLFKDALVGVIFNRDRKHSLDWAIEYIKNVSIITAN